MTQYKIIGPQDALEYARTQLNYFAKDAQLNVEALSDGKLNRVFKVVDESGVKSVIIKQAHTSAKSLGHNWSLTSDRTRIAAERLQTHERICPQHSAHIIKYDAKLCVLIMEDLSDHQILRSALIKRRQLPFVGEHIGVYLARTLFFTSDYYLPLEQKKQQISQYLNPEMCRILEDLYFNDPYRTHERNKYNLMIAADAEKIQQDQTLHSKVAELKYKFLNNAQALLHGDVHTGNIFVNEASSKVINGEFGFFGPIGFDLGTVLAGFLLNYIAQPGLTDKNVASVYRIYLTDQINLLMNTFSAEFARLMAAETKDFSFRLASYQEKALRQINQDAVGYAGVEMIRRTLGLMHVEDLDKIEHAQQRGIRERHALEAGRALIMQAEHLSGANDIIALVERVVSKEETDGSSI